MGEVELTGDEKTKILVEQNGWSRDYAGGYVAGEALRTRQETLPLYVMVGIDEWARGCRDGFFTRSSRKSS